MFQLRYVLVMLWFTVFLLKSQQYLDPINLGILVSLGIFFLLKAHDSFFKYRAEKRINMLKSKRGKEEVFSVHKNTNALIYEQGHMFIEMLRKLDLIYNVLLSKNKSICKKTNITKHAFKGVSEGSNSDCKRSKKTKNNTGFEGMSKKNQKVEKKVFNNPGTARNIKKECCDRNIKVSTQNQSCMTYSSDTIVNNSALLTPVGSYNQIAENMINSPIYIWSIKDNLTAKPHLNSTKKFKKICLEEGCENLMLSDTPIISNQCSKCLSFNGLGIQSMDFFQYIVTGSYPKLEYFCSCFLCRFGETKQCLEKRCKMCTTPKISLRP